MSKQHVQCLEEVVVSQLIKTQTKVSLEPTVNEGVPRVCCLDSSIRPIRSYNERQDASSFATAECVEPGHKCAFILTQLLCVEIPIDYGVNVEIEKRPVQCSRPWVGLCESRSGEASMPDDEEE